MGGRAMRPSRRQVLAAAAAGLALGAGAPRAAGSAPLKRLLVWVTSHGTVYERWALRPEGTDDAQDFELDLASVAADDLPPLLAPLADVRQHLVVLDGLSNPVGALSTQVPPHDAGQATCLTGSTPRWEGGLAVPSGPSLDQVVADALQQPGRLRSLIYSLGGAPVSFDATGVPVPAETDPRTAAARLFPAAWTSDEEGRLAAARPGVLELVADRADAVAPRLGGEDGARLELHATLVRELAVRIDGGHPSCPAPPEPDLTDPADPAQADLAASAFLDLAVEALACDLAPVVVFRHDLVSPASYGEATGDLHQTWAHEVATTAEAEHVMSLYHQAHAVRFASLVQRLADEGLLADTLVVWHNELGTGDHRMTSVPLIMAGGTAAFAPGRYLRYGPRAVLSDADLTAVGPPLNAWMVSVLRAFGVDVSAFGATSVEGADGTIDLTGPLSGL